MKAFGDGMGIIWGFGVAVARIARARGAGIFFCGMILSSQCRRPIIPRRKRGGGRTGSSRARQLREGSACSRGAGRRDAADSRSDPRESRMTTATRARLPREAFRAGWEKTIATPYFLLKRRRNGGTRRRIGVVIGVAAAKTAARRNFWKRQAREALSAAIPANRAAPDDLLLIFSPKVSRITKKEFRKTVEGALSRIGA